MEIKPCSQCKHQASDLLFRLFGASHLIRCERPNRDVDLVTGRLKETFCSNQRMYGECGPVGKYFEQK